MKNIIIRKAVWEDMDNILTIKQQAHDIYVDERPDVYKDSDTLYTEDFLLSFFENEDKVIFVALLDDEIVSFCFLECMKVTLPMMVERKYAYIHDFAVLEKYRRQGIASKMMSYIEEYAVAHGATSIELAVHLFSEDAITMYEKIGFSPRAKRMEKDLNVEKVEEPEEEV